MKRLIVLSLTALLAAGYTTASFAADSNGTNSSVGIGKSDTDYYRHRRHHHCRRGWYGMDNPGDYEVLDTE